MKLYQKIGATALIFGLPILGCGKVDRYSRYERVTISGKPISVAVSEGFARNGYLSILIDVNNKFVLSGILCEDERKRADADNCVQASIIQNQEIALKGFYWSDKHFNIEKLVTENCEIEF